MEFGQRVQLLKGDLDWSLRNGLLTTQLPKFRSDLEVVPRVVEGEGLRYFLKNPQTGGVFSFREEEYFIWRRLDGQTSLIDIPNLFYQRFHIPLDPEQLEAFVRYLTSLDLIDYTLPSEEPPLHFPVYYRKHSLGNPDPWLQRLAPCFSWCFTRTFIVGVAILVLTWFLILIHHFHFYRYEVEHNLWRPGPFVLETLLGVFLINLVGEFAKAIALKHWGGSVPGFFVGLAYRVVPTFHFDMIDLWTKEKHEQLKILSAGLIAQLALVAIAMLGWRLTTPWTGIHTFWLVFTVAAHFFFLINLIPLLPRDGYYLLAAWLEIPGLFTRSRSLVEAWFFRRPLPEPLTSRQQTWFKVFGGGSILFLFSFWLLVLGTVGYCLIWYWNLRGLGACLLLIILGLRYGDNMKLLSSRLFSRKGHSSNQRVLFTRRLVWLGALIILIVAFLIPYPYDAGGNFRILPTRQLSIRAVVPGKIAEVLVDEGEWVKKGQTLAVLLDKDYRARREGAKEALTAAQEKLAMMREGAKPEEIAKAEQEVKLAQKILQYSRIAADRYAQMFREKSVPEEVYMEKLKARDVDQERVALAQNNLALVKAPFRLEEIGAQEAEVRRLEAELNLAEKNLQLTRICAPAEGRLITALPLQKTGQYLNPGDLMTVIEDTRTIQAEIEVPEDDIALVKVGARVKLKTWASPTKTYIGQVTAIAPTAYNALRHRVQRVLTEREFQTMQVLPDQGQVIRVISELAETDGLLYTDMTGYAKIHGEYMPLGVAFTRWLVRFALVEVWSWIP